MLFLYSFYYVHVPSEGPSEESINPFVEEIVKYKIAFCFSLTFFIAVEVKLLLYIALYVILILLLQHVHSVSEMLH